MLLNVTVYMPSRCACSTIVENLFYNVNIFIAHYAYTVFVKEERMFFLIMLLCSPN